MVHLFGEVIFNKSRVTSKAFLHLKYLWDQYRSQLERARSHERLPSIPNIEWIELMTDAHEKALRKAEKTPIGPERYDGILIV